MVTPKRPEISKVRLILHTSSDRPDQS
jgi:hypothetical protein